MANNDGNNDMTDYFTPCAVRGEKLVLFNPGLPCVADYNLGVVTYRSRHHLYTSCTLVVN